MSSRMGGWLGGSMLDSCNFLFLFSCSEVIALVISGGAWLNAFSRMAAPKVPFCSRRLTPLGRLSLPPPPRVMHMDTYPIVSC
jgi:hypothetical protein